ncbi:MAG: PD-(D/E)XK nuclease family protein [Verrucomicrobiota bacterium]
MRANREPSKSATSKAWAQQHKKVQVLMALYFEDLWHGALKQWIENQRDVAWKRASLTVLLVPSRPHVHYIKQLVLKQKRGLLGIRLWTPQECRHYLLGKKHLSGQHLNEATLNLIAGLAAYENQSSYAKLAQAFSRKGGKLIKEIESFIAAGYDPKSHLPYRLKEFYEAVEIQLKKLDVKLASELDAFLAYDPSEKIIHHPAVIEHLFVWGFQGDTWPLRNVLRAAIHHSTHVTMAFPSPRWKGEEMDQVWISSWEKYLSTPSVVLDAHHAEPKKFAWLAETIEASGSKGEVKQPNNNIRFYLCRDAKQEAQIAVQQIIQWLSSQQQEQKDIRIGVLVPRGGILSRFISKDLDALKISHYDGVGHHKPGPFESEPFHAWLETLEQHRIKPLLRFIFSYEKQWEKEAFNASDIERALVRGFEETLIDRVDVIAAWLINQKAGLNREIGLWLQDRITLASEDSFSGHLERVKRYFEILQWEALWGHVEYSAALFSQKIENKMPRSLFTNWLRDVCVSRLRVRIDSGQETLSKVHILPYAHADLMPWSHLLLCGMNEDGWPHIPESLKLVQDEKLNQLNWKLLQQQNLEDRDAAALDLQAQGYLLGDQQKLWLQQRQLLNLLENTTESIAVSAAWEDPQQEGRSRMPGEFYNRVYSASTGNTFTESERLRIEHQTRQFLQLSPQSSLFKSTLTRNHKNSADAAGHRLTKTTEAFIKRRSGDAFTEYDFSLKTSDAKTLNVSSKTSKEKHYIPASDWDRLKKGSAQLFLQRVLKVEPAAELNSSSLVHKVRGIWAHRCLRYALGSPSTDSGQTFGETFHEIPSGDSVCERISVYIDLQKDLYEKLLQPYGLQSSARVHSLWSEIENMVHTLSTPITEESMRNQWRMAIEQRLASDTQAKIGTTALDVSGQMDAVLQTEEKYWIIDFKTGSSSQKLSKANLHRGKGLQVALYILALSDLTQRKAVSASILSLYDDLSKPQLDLSALDTCEDLWLGLNRVQTLGIFGWHGKVRDAYSFGKDYPLATLQVDPQLLSQKWKNTHPQLEDFLKGS